MSTGVTTHIVFAGGFRVGKAQGDVNYYYHLDRLGSVRLVTQTPNLQTFTAKYLPYGNQYATSGAENFQYTGKQMDVSTGLYYYGYRYLDSQSGRFMTVDPAQPNYLNPQSLNQYIYALDNPNRYNDPTGAISKQDTMTTPAQKKQQQEEDEEDLVARVKYERLLKALGWWGVYTHAVTPTTPTMEVISYIKSSPTTVTVREYTLSPSGLEWLKADTTITVSENEFPQFSEPNEVNSFIYERPIIAGLGYAWEFFICIVYHACPEIHVPVGPPLPSA
ncbi:MAG: RHS repeat-associated core domain-containing protein [Candidatus Bathyarchaeia archaeon]